MTKKRHSKDRLYIVRSEFDQIWGGYKKQNDRLPFHILPFNYCALTLMPADEPVATKEGIVFDKQAILTYLKKFKKNPVDGSPLKRGDLINLAFHKNEKGQEFCPVTHKTFNDHTYIVANGKTGHVYSYDAIREICMKGNDWKDFMTEEPFSRSDLITIQSPHDSETRRLDRFEFLKKNEQWDKDKDKDKEDGDKKRRKVEEEEDEDGVNESSLLNYEADDILGSSRSRIQTNDLMERALEAAKESVAEKKAAHAALGLSTVKNDTTEGHNLVDGTPAAGQRHELFSAAVKSSSFTSSVVSKKKTGENEFRLMTDKEVRHKLYQYMKKNLKNLKGYVTLITSLGKLNIELHAGLVPETVHNFMLLCQNGSYDQTVFHRMIPGFMIQGGDPTGTGTGGRCAFAGERSSFDDDFHPTLVHDCRGILSMANSGPHTNKAQFFITFRQCSHLDRKHSIFGRLVGGLETLDKLERLQVGKDDRPKEMPKILSVQIFSDPFKQAEEEIDKNKIKDDKPKSVLESTLRSSLIDSIVNSSAPSKTLPPQQVVLRDKKKTIPPQMPKTEPSKTGSGKFNFSNW